MFYPFTKAHLSINLDNAFKRNETEKKTKYNSRVVTVEHGTFTPIVFSSYGGAGVETNKFFSKLIEMTAEKKNLVHSVVANYMRTKVSFELVRSQVACLRGSRRLWKMKIDSGDMELVTNASTIRE